MIDWEKWMAENHIKIGGNSNVNRDDEKRPDGGVSGSKVATKVSDYVRSTGDCNLQKHGPDRKASKAEDYEET